MRKSIATVKSARFGSLGHIRVLTTTGVTAYPFLQAAAGPLAGTEDAPLDNRVDNNNTKLIDMNGCLNSLQAPLPPLNPILNTPDSIFDDKMAVANASLRGGIRGTALPLLLDLARKPNFLHDNSVPTMDSLLNPSRGVMAPHPFYFSDAGQRADMVEFLRGLTTTP